MISVCFASTKPRRGADGKAFASERGWDLMFRSDMLDRERLCGKWEVPLWYEVAYQRIDSG